MIRKTPLVRLSAILALLTFSGASLLAARGSADFTRYVAIGDSLTAGYSNDSLLIAHQQFSYPAVIARQTGAPDFQQPLISEPGIPAELILVSLLPSPQLARKSTGNGAPLNLGLPRPYNNLGIPGARVRDILNQVGASAGANPFYQLVLRGQGSAVDQALAFRPTFITIWAGNNDVLAAVTSGSPAALTPIDQFTTDYRTLLDRLVAGAPTAGMVAALVPDVTAIPFATTIPPILVNPATSQPVLGPDGRPIFFIADLGGGNVNVLPAGSLVTLGASSLLATGFGIPAALAPAFPTLPNVGKPLPDQVVITPTELATISARVTAVNEVISATARTHDIPVVDFTPVLSSYRGLGRNFGNIILSSSFLTGGVFSFDGVHPTDIGYTIVANEFIRVINDNYDADIPHASITRFFENNAPVEASGSDFEFSLQPIDFSTSSMFWQELLVIPEPSKETEEVGSSAD